ncbi:MULTISPECIES: putative lipid II flippase FtsW [unclassified Pseudoclavibacter]|uniref:putative lipid II flippase FtsW n=1 Tax=unclassified Pseudoclavibacter TaxID=2615177 RepID=UPI0013013068|nr:MULTISPECIES: putative lipid II flippase FtsW [unclassified Pseudoclavibacter]KAB1658194.1 putative lipid II flippase FtsW [Pseudoclavibacter sp. CFCC 11306]KAB1661896.1 putative lipid II flippase FtsW [Pseudoclavibacter sp. CFCC 13796]
MSANNTRIRLLGGQRHITKSFGQLLGVITLLLLLGLTMVLSASSIDSYSASNSFFSLFMKQGLIALLAFPAMLLVSRIPMEVLRRWSKAFLIATMLVQLLVVSTSLGSAGGGNRNWLNVGGFTVQPSEFMKLALVIWLGRVLSERRDDLTSLKAFVKHVLVWVVAAIALVMAGRDLGTAMVMLIIVFGCFFVGRVPLRFLGALAVAGGIIAGIFAIGSANRLSRIASWAGSSGCTDYSGTCWQTTHGTWALAAGGIFGVGLGNSKSKWAWLPEAENDFIFAIIGEELGLVGLIALIGLYVLLAVLMVRLIVRLADRPFEQIVVAGALTWTVGQAFINIAVVLGLLPVLGVPLPLVSYGGSSLVANLLMLGVVLGIANTERTSS